MDDVGGDSRLSSVPAQFIFLVTFWQWFYTFIIVVWEVVTVGQATEGAAVSALTLTKTTICV